MRERRNQLQQVLLATLRLSDETMRHVMPDVTTQRQQPQQQAEIGNLGQPPERYDGTL